MKRIGYVLLATIGAVILSASVSMAPASAHPGPAGAVGVVAAIDLRGLFGDENEPDENDSEQDTSTPKPAAKASPRGHGRSVLGLPLDVALPLAGGILALAAIAALVVRWVRRYRAWKRRMAFRVRASMRRLGDDLDRARRRGFRP